MWLAVVAGVVLLLAAAWAATLWTRPEPIRIAFASSLSGPSAPAGTESIVATQLAIDEVNVKGGVNGRPIELVPFDDASNPAVARANVQAIADSPCVAVLGHYLSSASLAAGPGYKDARIPALTGSAAADDLTSGNELLFSCANADLRAGALGCGTSARRDEGAKSPPRSHARFLRQEFCARICDGLSDGAVACVRTGRRPGSDRIDGRGARRCRAESPDPALSSSALQPILSQTSSRRCAAAALRGRSSQPRARPAKAICKISPTSPRKRRVRLSSVRICTPQRR